MYNREQADELEAQGWMMVEVTALGDQVESFAKGLHLSECGITEICLGRIRQMPLEEGPFDDMKTGDIAAKCEDGQFIYLTPGNASYLFKNGWRL